MKRRKPVLKTLGDILGKRVALIETGSTQVIITFTDGVKIAIDAVCKLDAENEHQAYVETSEVYTKKETKVTETEVRLRIR